MSRATRMRKMQAATTEAEPIVVEPVAIPSTETAAVAPESLSLDRKGEVVAALLSPKAGERNQWRSRPQAIPSTETAAVAPESPQAARGGIRCPKCHNPVGVHYVRHRDDGGTFRSHHCGRCAHKFCSLQRIIGNSYVDVTSLLSQVDLSFPNASTPVKNESEDQR